MKSRLLIPLSLGIIGFVVLLTVVAHGGQFPLLDPAGTIGLLERDLMVRTVFLMLIVVIPVFILIIFVGWFYRAENTKAKYTPNWENSAMEELIWWSVPLEIVLVLAALTWSSTHELDPMRALNHPKDPVVVEVVALPWKWLFIYPEQGIASVNEVAFPADAPIEFHITADAPMNSFWIPALGGQMYAMTGMSTSLHLIAPEPGDFAGRSANYSGEGFSQMTFTARALEDDDFENWVKDAKASGAALTPETYAVLAEPSDTGPVRYYGSVTMPFSAILNSFMSMPVMDHIEHH
ncbi:MAG: ubiquinol oxidase, subunit II [Parcubacteria bacterium C7867-008]|nr:MAG: ubiquinol oxidase, subunit II [Parcubacteria bacterium C7867-008]